jgi:hypothetical protein
MAATSPPLRSIASRISRSDTPPHRHTIIFGLLTPYGPAASRTVAASSIAPPGEGYDEQTPAAAALQLHAAVHQPRDPAAARTAEIARGVVWTGLHGCRRWPDGVSNLCVIIIIIL